jgi:hypothetical protein
MAKSVSSSQSYEKSMRGALTLPDHDVQLCRSRMGTAETLFGNLDLIVDQQQLEIWWAPEGLGFGASG